MKKKEKKTSFLLIVTDSWQGILHDENQVDYRLKKPNAFLKQASLQTQSLTTFYEMQHRKKRALRRGLNQTTNYHTHTMDDGITTTSSKQATLTL